MAMHWKKVSLILCTFGFFRTMCPSDSFLTDFLSGPWRNLTSEQVNREVYPVSTYSYLAQMIIFFLITDMLRYQPIIIMSAVLGIIIWTLLLWTTTLVELQITEVLYGTYAAAEVAYYVYIYAKVDKSKYQQVTAHTRSANLAGKFLAGVLAQVIVSADLMDLRQLNFISLGSQCISLVAALFLPTVKTSIYFHASDTPIEEASPIGKEKSKAEFSIQKAFNLLGVHLKSGFSNSSVVKWSIWYVVSTCGYMMITFYSQLLWQVVDPHHEYYYNGAIDAALMLFGSLAAFFSGFMKNEFLINHSNILLTTLSAVMGGLLVAASAAHTVWIPYIAHVLFGALYQFMITVASSMIARELVEDSFALIFGINSFVALVLQTLMTITVISESGFKLGPRDQFLVLGLYFIVIAFIYGLVGASKLLKFFKSNT